MAWYGNHVDSSKKLDQLLDQNPTLQQLLNYPDFMQQLKAYNPKLLDFLTNSTHIVAELINYISVPPNQQDSAERKHKLPTLSIQMVESDAMSILNGFFKQNVNQKQKYFVTMFDQLLNVPENKQNGQVLPLLAGYFLRVNIALLTNKHKQVVDIVYQNERLFQLLLSNCQNISITNVLQVYLNLDLTKNNVTIPERMNIKLKTISNIMGKISDCVDVESVKKPDLQIKIIRLENLSGVLLQLLEKYYLIAEGKQMVDQILNNEAHINTMFNKTFFFQNITPNQPSYEISLSMLTIITSILKYYSFSSFNLQQVPTQPTKKNQSLLQSQLSIIKFIQIFPKLIQPLQNSSQIKELTIYHLKLIETINTSLTLNSHKIFNCVKKYRYLETLIDLLFRFQKCNILGMMVEKLFLLIFRTERQLNEEIKSYIFCQAKIIDLTAARYMTEFANDQQLAASMTNNYRRKGFFGHLMKVMKIYSSIQTTNQDIINAIKSRSDIWNRISRFVLKPYEFINCKQLGTYENIPEKQPTQFTVRSIISANNNLTLKKQIQDSNKLIEQINRQETIQNLKTLQSTSSEAKIQPENYLTTNNNVNENEKAEKTDDEFFKPPTQNSPDKIKKESSFSEIPQIVIQKQQSAPEAETASEIESVEEAPTNKKALSYTDFLQKEKVKVETEIKKQRSRSKERALSKGKTKITSPSPTKRVNKWAQQGQQNKQQVKQRVSLTTLHQRPSLPEQKMLPKIPHHKKGLNISSNSNFMSSKQDHNKSMQLQRKSEQGSNIDQNERRFSKSMLDLSELKKVKIIYQFEVPTKKQYRRITEQDKAVFDMLGIAIQ